MFEKYYQILKETLDCDVAIEWLLEDAIDDFYPDPILYKDILQFKSEYLEQRKHRILQIDVLSSIMGYVPKSNGMLREAIWLHPTHRIIYLSILHHLLPKLDKFILPSIYSYRSDSLDHLNEYPFRQRTDRWKRFHNDFRAVSLEETTGAILLTDISSFYDHISVDHLCDRLETMLGGSLEEPTKAVIKLLKSILNLWATKGYGIPQNFDPSSFLGSIYLQNIDIEMNDRRYRYFRWVDDMRICAKNKQQAFRALHDLQLALAKERLFLATEKTKIIEKGTKEFEELMDVQDDVILSEAEETIASGAKAQLEVTTEVLLKRLSYHATLKGDERKFRAFANRLLNVGDYKELKSDLHAKVRSFVLPKLRSYPSRSDYWTKMLSVSVNEELFAEVKELLIEQKSQFDWQRFHLWKLLVNCDKGMVPPELLNEAISVTASGVSSLVSSAAVICVGKHGTNVDRERMFASLYTQQTPYLMQRSILIAIQELPQSVRDKFYNRALQINPEHKQLIEFIPTLKFPFYGERYRRERSCQPEPKEINVILKSGIGLVNGRKTMFRLSKRDYDY